MGKRKDKQNPYHTRRTRERSIKPLKRMHGITIKHTREQVYVHTAEANYLGNRNVFRLDLKDGRAGIWRSDRVREFQSEGPVNEKARWPAVVDLVRGRDPDNESVGGRAESSGSGVELEAVGEI